MKRSPLRRRRARKPARPQDSPYNLEAGLYDCACWFKQERGWEGECRFREDGRPDRAHLIPKQRLLRDRPELDVWAPELWVPACRFHHDRADRGGLLGLQPAEFYPSAFLAAAERHGFFLTPGGFRCAHRPVDSLAV